jgi:hypothetical protein
MQRSIALIAIWTAASQVEAQPIHPRFASSQLTANSIQFTIEFEEPLAEALDALGPGVLIFEMYVDAAQDFTDKDPPFFFRDKEVLSFEHRRFSAPLYNLQFVSQGIFTNYGVQVPPLARETPFEVSGNNVLFDLPRPVELSTDDFPYTLSYEYGSSSFKYLYYLQVGETYDLQTVPLVPEPSTLMLGAMAALLAILFARFRQASFGNSD